MRAKHLINANLGDGMTTYALLSDGWNSVNANFNTGEVFDIRWKATDKEIEKLTLIFKS